MPLATKAGLYGAAVILSFAGAVAGIILWGSSDDLPRPVGNAPAALGLLPIRLAQEHYAALAREVTAHIDAQPVETGNPPAGTLTLEIPAPDVFTPASEPSAGDPVSAPGDADAVTEAPPTAPGLFSIPIPTAAPTPPPPPGGLNYGLADQLIALINGARDSAGVPQLTRHGSLMAAAESYARFHFLNTDPFALNHYLDGSPGDRAQRAGFSGLAGEVLVVGGASAQSLFDSWMGSPPHHDILLDPAFAWIGLGCYEAPYRASNGSTFEAALCVGDLGG